MEDSEMSETEKKVFQTGLFDHLTVQDAITIIAIYAAQLDPEDCKEDIDRITVVLNNDSLFDEDYSDTLDRINKFANSMEEVNPLNVIERAAKMLTPELQQKSFMLAAQIRKATEEKRTAKILGNLASKLTIDKEIVNKTIDSTF